MTQNKQALGALLDELRDYALEYDADDPAYSNGDRIVHCSETIRAALEEQEVDVDLIENASEGVGELFTHAYNFDEKPEHPHNESMISWAEIIQKALHKRGLIRGAGDGWREIRTYPKQEKPRVLLSSDSHIWIGRGGNTDEGYWFNDSGYACQQPTHYMPLPEPPKGQKQ